MSIKSPYSSLLSGSSTTAAALPCAVGTGTTATAPSSQASVGSETGAPSTPGAHLRHFLLCDALALGPRGLEDEGLLLNTIGRALLRAPASFPSRIRSGGAGRVALTSLNFNVGSGGAVRAAPAGLLGIVGLSSRFGATLAGVAFLLCPSLLRRPGPSGQGLP